MTSRPDRTPDWLRNPRTGAERYFARRMTDPDYAAEYHRARARIDAIDEALREDRRCDRCGIRHAGPSCPEPLEPDQDAF